MLCAKRHGSGYVVNDAAPVIKVESLSVLPVVRNQKRKFQEILPDIGDFCEFKGCSLEDVVHKVAPFAREMEEMSFFEDMNGLNSMIERVLSPNPPSTVLISLAGRLLQHGLRHEAYYFYWQSFLGCDSQVVDTVVYDSLLQIAKMLKGGHMSGFDGQRSAACGDEILHFLVRNGPYEEEAKAYL